MDRIEQCKQLDLRSVIEQYGGEFGKGGMFSIPSLYGREATPSGKIYTKGGQQLWHHFRTGTHGDAIEFVKMTMGVETNKAISMLLGEEGKTQPKISRIDKAEIQAREMREKALKEQKDKAMLYAITKNATPLLESNLCCEYLMKRGISTAALTLHDPRIQIFENTFKDKQGQDQHRICYSFQGNGKNSDRFMILKGIDDNGNKTGYKQNIGHSRPVFHQSKPKEPFIITEGIEDALSAKELGYHNFISLNSTSNARKFMDSLIDCPKFYANNTFEICLDNDKAGKEATKEIMEFCKDKIDIKESEYYGIMQELGINDLNDLLVKEYIDPLDRLMDWSKENKEIER